MTDHTNAKILVDQIVPPGEPWSGIVKKGQILRIIDLEGRQAVDLNFLSALRTHGLGWKDIVPNVNFFCNVPVLEEGKLAISGT